MLLTPSTDQSGLITGVLLLQDLGKVGSSMEVTRGWFDDNIWKEIGDGLQTLFWHDIWVGNQSLKLVFPRLFRLASNNQSRVCDNGVWRDDVWKWDIVWRRSLFGRDESLAKNLYDLIHNHSCKRSSLDRWRWSLDASGDYVVKTAYLAQLTHQQSLIGKELTNCWINYVSLTICCFVWKLIRGRFPTWDELFKRNVIIRVDDMLCIFCNNHVETVDHLFVSCDFASSIWKCFYAWLQISVINPSLVLDSLKLHDFVRRGCCPKLWRMFWFTVVWSLWIMRNKVIFMEKKTSYVNLIEIIQIRSWI
ncbi:hypothetical protein Lal_00012053, partial [Lupinus albus]